MKTKLMIIGIGVLMCSVSFKVYQKHNSKNLSNLVMENVEALAGDESNGTVTIPCALQKDATCKYTVRLVTGQTQERTENGAKNVN